MRLTLLFFAASLSIGAGVFACSSTDSAAPNHTPDAAVPGDDAGDADSGSDADGGAFVPYIGPSVPFQGGRVLHHPILVTITYSDDTNRAQAEALDTMLVTSSWLSQVGPEYGVNLGTHVEVRIADTSPLTIDDSVIQSTIADLIASDKAPGNHADGGAPEDYFYLFYFPNRTSVTADGVDFCNYTDGYHLEGKDHEGLVFPYGVVAPCSTKKSELDVIAASHEFIEGCSDPFPNTDPAYFLTDSHEPWTSTGGEIGDMCSFLEPQWSEGGFDEIQRVWSNAAAKAGKNPCVPVTKPYYGLSPTGKVYQEVAAGKSATFDFTAFADGAHAAWKLQAQPEAPYFGAAFTPTISTLTHPAVSPGETTSVTVTVPAGTPSGASSLILMTSYVGELDYTTALVEVSVP